jgi:hypothetical protein
MSVKLTPIRRPKHGPEWHLQQDHVEWMEARGWHGERMIGNALQVGIPDYLFMHPRHGQRWVDYKNPKSYEFTPAQIIKWPIWERNNVGIWIITEVTQEQYDLLFTRLPLGNWRDYWKDKYDYTPTEVLIDALAEKEREMAMSRDRLRDGSRNGRRRVDGAAGT